MSAEVETMFYNRETPWHGLGTRVEDAQSSKEALELAGLNWSVNPQPVFIMNNGTPVAVPNTIANVRDSDNSVLGIVTNHYKLCQNKEAFSFTDGILGNGVKYETAGSLFKGKKVWMLAKMPDSEIVGDKFENYLAFVNSHDGKGAIQVVATSVRIVCNNTLNIALKGASRKWSTKHMGNLESKMAESHRTLELSSKYQTAFSLEAERLAFEKVGKVQFQIFVETLIPIADDISLRSKNNFLDMRDELTTRYEMAPDLANIKGTKWGVLQAVSDFATHRTPKRLTDKYQDSLFDDSISGNSMTDFAYQLLKA